MASSSKVATRIGVARTNADAPVVTAVPRSMGTGTRIISGAIRADAGSLFLRVERDTDRAGIAFDEHPFMFFRVAKIFRVCHFALL